MSVNTRVSSAYAHMGTHCGARWLSNYKRFSCRKMELDVLFEFKESRRQLSMVPSDVCEIVSGELA